MAKSGPLKFLLPALGGLAAIGTLGAGLPALLGGEAIAGGLGEGAALGAGELGAGAGELGAGAATAGELAAGPGAFLLPGTETALTGGFEIPAALGAETLGAGAGALGGDLATAGGVSTNLTGAGDIGSNIAALPTTAGGSPISNLAVLGSAPDASGVAATGPSLPYGTESLGGGLTDSLQSQLMTAAGENPAAVAGGGVDGAGGGIGDVLGGAWDKTTEILGSPGFKSATALGSLGLLGSQLLKGNPQYPEQKLLNKSAASDLSLGSQLAAPITTGALPSGARSWVDSATAASKARTRSAYAEAGLSGSTMEQQALGAIDERSAGEQFKIADKLLTDSLSYTTLGEGTVKSLLNTSIAQDKDYQTALYNFAKALSGTNVT